jgi:hypothetical protein
MKIDFNIELDQKVSSGLCFILIIILSALVAWKVITVAEKVTDAAPNNAAFNIEKRAE